MERTRLVITVFVVVALLPGEGAGAATTFLVTSSGDAADVLVGDGVCDAGAGACTLRAAIQEVNATAPSDARITFSAGMTIAPLSALPQITARVTIDGRSAPGFAGVPVVELSGASAGAGAIGLRLSGTGSRVEGLAINRFTSHGIELRGSGHAIEGNHIGTDVNGAIDLGNTRAGVSLNLSSNNVIGGAGPGEGNVISGNDDGIFMIGSGNRVLGNLIGTDATGTADLGNTGTGVFASGSGGLLVEGNVIAGNATGVGLQLGGAGRVVRGNRIGTDAAGTQAIGNGRGISLNQAGGVTIEGNVVSGNTGDGIALAGSGSNSGTIRGNLIGVAADGTTPLGNGGDGIHVGVTAHDNAIGGLLPAEANTIAFNAADGVFVDALGTPARANAIRGNAIFDNGGLGIDLGADGVLANDPGDADAGANDQQNSPTVQSASAEGGLTHVEGTLGSLPSMPFAIDLYSAATCDAAGAGEGASYLASVSVTTDADGNASFVTDVADLPVGSVVTATATDAAGNTSEFSSCVAANHPPAPVGDVVTAVEDTVASIDTATLLANDTDPDGDALEVVAVSDAIGGAVSLGGGAVAFTPALNLCGEGAGAFTYSAADPGGLMGRATVRVDIACVIEATRLVAEPVIAYVQPGPALTAPGVGAVLTTDDDGTPVAGRVVRFDAGGTHVCDAVTDDDGVARCGDLPESVTAALALGYSATFDGDEDFLPSAASAGLVGLG